MSNVNWHLLYIGNDKCPYESSSFYNIGKKKKRTKTSNHSTEYRWKNSSAKIRIDLFENINLSSAGNLCSCVKFKLWVLDNSCHYKVLYLCAKKFSSLNGQWHYHYKVFDPPLAQGYCYFDNRGLVISEDPWKWLLYLSLLDSRIKPIPTFTLKKWNANKTKSHFSSNARSKQATIQIQTNHIWYRNFPQSATDVPPACHRRAFTEPPRNHQLDIWGTCIYRAS